MAPKNESTDSPAGGKSLVGVLVKTNKYTRGACRSDLNLFGVSSGGGCVMRFFPRGLYPRRLCPGGGWCPRQLKKIELHVVCVGNSLIVTVTQKAQHIGVQFDVCHQQI